MALPFIGGEIWNAELKGRQLADARDEEQNRALQMAIQQGLAARKQRVDEELARQKLQYLEDQVGVHYDANDARRYGYDANANARMYGADAGAAARTQGAITAAGPRYDANNVRRESFNYKQGRDTEADDAANSVLNQQDGGVADMGADTPPNSGMHSGGVAELHARRDAGQYRQPARVDLNNPEAVADTGREYGQKISDLTTRNTAITNMLANPSLGPDEKAALQREQAGVQGSIQAIQVKVQGLAKQANSPQKAAPDEYIEFSTKNSFDPKAPTVRWKLHKDDPRAQQLMGGIGTSGTSASGNLQPPANVSGVATVQPSVDPYTAARAAIANGADPEIIRSRLVQHGLDPSQL